jgi:beta-lactamase superfamily II metal-dependent hydrolase
VLGTVPQKFVVVHKAWRSVNRSGEGSVAILLTYGTARVLLAGDAEGREEQYMASGPYTGALTVVNVSNHKHIRARVSRPADRRSVRDGADACLAV